MKIVRASLVITAAMAVPTPKPLQEGEKILNTSHDFTYECLLPSYYFDLKVFELILFLIDFYRLCEVLFMF